MSEGNPLPAPDVTVLLATRNRSALLETTLKALAAQDVGGLRWRVLVVDNASDDDTADVIRRASADLPIQALREQRLGKSRALNTALGAVGNELVILTDDDVCPEPGWVRGMQAAALRWPSASIFGGAVKPLYPDAAPTWLRTHHFARAAFAWFELSMEEGPLPDGVLPFGPNFAVRGAVLRSARFDEELGPRGDDYAMGAETQLLQRLRAAGHVVVYVPSSVVHHVVQPFQLTPDWLARRAYRHGRGLARLEGSTAAPRLAGAPRWLWRAAATSGIRAALARMGRQPARLDASVRFQRLRGQLHEHRLMSREFRAAGQRTPAGAGHLPQPE